jgi:hypothetical protein
MNEYDILVQLHKFAKTISNQLVERVPHNPPPWAKQIQCFENATNQARIGGGCVQSGWMFQYKVKGYLIAIHHAVWKDPDGHLFDVTPFHQDAINHPLTSDNAVIFLIDDNAKPDLVARPSKFYPLSSDEYLIYHVKCLDQKEQYVSFNV